jgi:putative addiction module CopG family antidote
MTVQLPASYEQFVSEMLGTGSYRSPADVICDGLDLLRAQAAYRQHRLTQLREQVEAGLQQMRAGQVSEVDPMDLLNEIEQEFAEPPKA